MEADVDPYTEFDTPKKSGHGTRHVENPRRDLKRVQARLARILSWITPPDFLFCPVKRRCYVSNAAAHKDNRVVQCLDIKSFFPSTPQRRVFWFLHKVLKCKRDIAGLLAKLACYQGHLPTGSPLSPIMAYFAFYDLWQEIAEFCDERGHTFTVYIDDVTVSGERVSKGDMWRIRKMIHRRGLTAHKAKTYVDSPAEITGVIARGGELVAPFRQHHKKFMAKDLLDKAPIEEREALLGRISGIEGQIKQIAEKN
ncbi:reverse transcriptase family protein [Qipengyuania nanhaisediminis]|uniref:reverse transcriptase family protein n=1 Tax=Qipengyuania nanhaisediminis TaxID=604088 RepID=UPI0038B3F153